MSSTVQNGLFALKNWQLATFSPSLTAHSIMINITCIVMYNNKVGSLTDIYATMQAVTMRERQP